MPRKLLTAIDQIVSRTILTEETIRQRAVEWALAHMIARRTATTLIQKEATSIINIQHITTASALAGVQRLMPLLSAEETLRITSSLLIPSDEEELATRKRLLPYRKMQELETERAQRIRPEQMRQIVREIVLSRTSILMTDQTAFARLEQYLWTNFPLQIYQVLGELLEQVIRKSWYLDRITGLEPLEKLMLQMYVYAFMEFPLQMNILGMRVTPLTMSVLRHRVASIYMTYAIQDEAIKTRPYIGTTQARKQETKLVAGERSRREIVPTKENIAVTEDLDDITTVSTGRNLFGREVFFTILRYAYSMPFWLRRRLARNFGMPENHKYARYFGIGCIPTRYARQSWKRRRYDDYSGFLYSRDEKIMKYIRYKEMHRTGVAFKGRYGTGRIWRRL